MTAFRIATQTASLGQSLRKALHTAAQVEADGVQFNARHEIRPAEISDTGLRQLRKLLDDLNLRVGSVAFPTRRGYANLADLERRLDATVEAMRFASRVRAATVILQLGRLPHDSDGTEMTTLRESLAVLAQHGTRLGVQLAAQVAFDDYEPLHAFLSLLPTGTLFLDLHPGKLLAQGHSPEEFVEKLGKHIAHVHASNAVRDLGSGSCVEVELGRGSVDFPAVIGRLEEFEYRGWVTIERIQAQQPLEDIGDAVKYLRSLQQSG